MPEVSFARDIIPLFRPVDIEHMKVHGVESDLYAFMSHPDNGDKVLANNCAKFSGTWLP